MVQINVKNYEIAPITLHKYTVEKKKEETTKTSSAAFVKKDVMFWCWLNSPFPRNAAVAQDANSLDALKLPDRCIYDFGNYFQQSKK